MKTIFLVDDDIANLKLGSSVLGELYNVITLNSGTRLLKMLLSSVDAANLPSLILLDIDMPEMNGYETISRIKKIDALSEIPVIFLTAKNNNENELKGLALGAIDYITKPFSAALLLKRIEIHLQLLEQKQELVRFNTNLQEMVDEKTLAVVELQNAIVQTISEMVDYHDDTTGSHILRTQAYLRILIEGLQKSGFKHNLLSNMNVELILQSSQLHDVGKIKVDSSILRKPGKLTDEERAEMEKHTIAGGEIIEKIKERTSQHEFLEQALIMATTHHERWDGSGYPYGLKGEDIKLQGRLMAIVDVYDSLVSERPYKPAYSHEESVEIIRISSGTHFDPELVEAFLSVSDDFKKITDSRREKKQ